MEQINNTPPTPDILLQTEAANAVPNATIDTGPPTSDEIETAIQKLKNNRAPGICGIKAELLKYGGNAIVTWLLTLFTLVWERCSIPADWTLAITLPLWKGKGSKSPAPSTALSLCYRSLLKCSRTSACHALKHSCSGNNARNKVVSLPVARRWIASSLYASSLNAGLNTESPYSLHILT